MSKKRPKQNNKPFWQEAPRPQKALEAKKRKRKEAGELKEAAQRVEKRVERKQKAEQDPVRKQEPMRLNRYIARAGVCSRREADALISRGEIAVNGKVVREMGIKVTPGEDTVTHKGKSLKAERLVYILLNKPKNMITTMSDPQGRRIVLEAIERNTQERVYPVGRLDRNTTGLLLLTNDGDLAAKLTHPSYRVKKIYQARLDKPVTEEHLEQLLRGVELEDGDAKADKADYVSGKDTNYVGIEVHIGRNRVVRRMFEQLGYQVEALDRVMIGHLTKKNLPRGKWRQLTTKEIGYLKML